MEVARATDVYVGYRRPVRGGFGPPAIKVVLQDGVDRGVGARADLQCPFAGGFEPLGAMAFGQPQNADASAEPLLGCVFSRRMTSMSAEVLRPISPARRLRLSGVQSAKRRWLDGMCSGTVVCLRLEDERTWAATRLPRWNTSTVRAVIGDHTVSRNN